MPLVGSLQSMKGAVVGGSLAIVSASAGIVWLSIAAAGGLAVMLGAFWSQVIVGAILLAPLTTIALIGYLQLQRRKRRDAEAAAEGGSDAALAAVVAAARKMLDTSPIAALSLATLAGLLSTGAPGALSLLAAVFEENDEPH